MILPHGPPAGQSFFRFRECDSGSTLNEVVRPCEQTELSNEIIHPQR
jgi:hypothetical protein